MRKVLAGLVVGLGIAAAGVVSANQRIIADQGAPGTYGSWKIGGAAADGAAIAGAGNPILVSGTDGTLQQTISVDSSGRQVVIGAGTAGTATGGVVTVQGVASMTPILATGTGAAGTAATGVVSVQGIASMTPVQVGGSAADGATYSGSPVPVGGTDGTNAQTLLTDTSGRPRVVGAAADGAAAAGDPMLVAGFDGTNAQSISTDSTGRPVVVGAGTAGSASGGVLTVQGVASMTPFLAAGTGTAGSAATGVVTVQGIASMTPVIATGSGSAGSAATGVLSVQGIASMTPLQVVGAAADGAAVSGNPLLIAGYDGTNAQSISTNTTGHLRTVSMAATSGAYGEVAVQTSATAVPTTGLAGRRSVSINNNGPNEIRCGFNNSVTTSTGTAVAANGGYVSWDITDAVTVYCIAKTANQSAAAATNYTEIAP